MRFEEILDQAIAMLQRRRRLTYGALKRQFQIDDAYLEDLKAELIEGQRLAVDEDGRVLVWTGGADMPWSATPSVSQSVQPTAERRQLTVLFCDLVDSTALAGQLDLEDWREVVRAYQTTCAEVIQQFEGYIAQYLGDGVLVYFGYPRAHEDDAQRAIRSGLGMIEALRTLNTRLAPAYGVHLAVRLGIHTGLVVVGEVGSGSRQELLALGDTPNVAARLQGLATPDTVVISDATSRLVQGYFDCQDLGAQTLRGVAAPVTIYRVLSESGAQHRLDIVSAHGLTPLVGRESEVTLLLERWEHVKAGQGQVVLLSGDAGIGKSRLVHMLKEYVAHEPHTRWECRSSLHFAQTALFPLTDLFHRLWRFHAEETLDRKLEKLEYALSQYHLPVEESVPLLAPLLALPLPANRYAPLNLSPQRQRQKTLETIVTMLLEHAEQHPVLFIVEDLHWADPSTLELLHVVLDQTPTASMLVLLTCRPTFQPSWSHRSYLTEMTLNRLSQPQIERMAERVAGGKTFPDEVLQHIIDKTDGVPLFVEEMTKAILESGHLKATAGHYELVGSFSMFVIPATLHDSLMARLDRLVTAKAIAQYAAVIGRQFTYALLQAVSQLDEALLQHELGRLVEAEIVYQRGLPPQASYLFKHALIQDTAYQSLLKSTRQGYHQRIAYVLEAQFPTTAEGQPELLAHHYTEAGIMEKAAHYWHHAGQRAIERSAHMEAMAHLAKGLELLQRLPATPERSQQELTLHIALGSSLLATKGFAAPEIEQTYHRAHHLCQHLEEPHQLFPVLRGLWNYYNVRAEYQTAHGLSEQLLALAQQVQDRAMLVAAHHALGATLFYLGAVAPAHTHCAQGIALYDPQQHRAYTFLYGIDSGVICHRYAAWALWYLGYPDQGLARNHEAVTLAQQSAHPFSLGFALSGSAIFHQFRREAQATQEHTEAVVRLATEQGFPLWVAYGAITGGWVLAQQGQAQEGMEQLRQGLTACHAIGAAILQPYFLALLAETHSTLGQPAAGLAVLTEALTLVDSTGERWYEPELYRLQGALLLQQSADHQTEARISFHHALDLARHQQAKAFELRAATSLARLWQQQGKREEASALLAPVYQWFTEGFDTADLREAKALLASLP